MVQDLQSQLTLAVFAGSVSQRKHVVELQELREMVQDLQSQLTPAIFSGLVSWIVSSPVSFLFVLPTAPDSTRHGSLKRSMYLVSAFSVVQPVRSPLIVQFENPTSF